MEKIVILTTTYNHPDHLMKLYESLLIQKYKKFTWLIVNDGSMQETEDIITKISEKRTIDVSYVYKKNGGKASATNMGLDIIEKDGVAEFVIVVDDDEELQENATYILNEYVEKYKNSDCGIIEFLHIFKGKTLEKYADEDFFLSMQERKNKNIKIDGYIGYFIKRIEGNRFPIFDNEKYIGPSCLIMQVERKYKHLMVMRALGETEYLEGGITKQGRELRVQNPRGGIYYCCLLLEKAISFKVKFKYSVLLYAYMYILKGKSMNDIISTITCEIIKWTRPLGVFLGVYWSNKYRSKR